MINFNKKEVIEIIKNRKSSKIQITNDLLLNFLINEDDSLSFTSIRLNYKGKDVGNSSFFYYNEISKTIDIVFIQIKDLFDSFIKEKQNYILDNEYKNTIEYLTIMIQKEIFSKSDELLIHSFNGLTIVSVQYESKNREILIMYLEDNGMIHFHAEILYTFENDKYDVYEPYDFMFRNMLFFGTLKYNQLSAELTYLLD